MKKSDNVQIFSQSVKLLEAGDGSGSCITHGKKTNKSRNLGLSQLQSQMRVKKKEIQRSFPELPILLIIEV